MAIKDSVYAMIGGTVERVHPNPKAPITVAVQLSEKDRYPSRVKVWPNGFTLTEGDRVKLRGFLSWRLNSYEKDGETKHNVEVFLNGAQVEERVEGSPQPTANDWGAGAGC